MEEKSIILMSDAMIKKVGGKFFLMRISFDYSKKDLIELTQFGATVVTYLRKVHKVKEVVKEFESIANKETVVKYLNFLVSEGYALIWGKKKDDSIKTLSSIQKEVWMEEHTPYGATIELTSKCNFKCVHCYLDNCHDKPELSFNEIKYILDQLANAGMLTIFLSGGEPLLRKDFVDIYLYAKKLGFLIVIFTNGFLLNDKLLNVFLQYPPLEIDLSIYGSSDEAYERITGCKGAFTTIKQNILKFKEHGVFVSAKTPVINLMINDLDNIQAFTREYDIPWRISFDIVPTIDNQSKENYQIGAKEAVELFKKYADNYNTEKEILVANLQNSNCGIGRKRYACGMGKSSCFVDYEGKVSPCIETRHRGISIFDEPFENIWKKIRDISYESIPDTVNEYRCTSCKLACICKSCPAVRERYYGQPYIVKDNDCAFAQELYNKIKEDL